MLQAARSAHGALKPAVVWQVRRLCDLKEPPSPALLVYGVVSLKTTTRGVPKGLREAVATMTTGERRALPSPR